MKKVWLVVALVALGALATSSFADVQNIRLSGDIRLRGYFLDGVTTATDYGTTTGEDNSHRTAAFITQRTRVNIEADLEDHVLVVVTLAAEGLWGQSSEVAHSAGAGLGANSSALNRQFAVGVSEAYVQLNEVFYSAATLKVGRQYLNYGRGLIISSVDQEYNFDAGRLVLDYYPLTLDIVGAQLVNNQGFMSSTPGGQYKGAANLLFLNARYEMTDSPIKNIEAYFGWIPNQNWNPGSIYSAAPANVPPLNANGTPLRNASPMIAGLRSDLVLGDAVTAWLEGVYEFGTGGDVAAHHLDAFLATVGAKIAPKGVAWSPALNAAYTYASGGGNNGQNGFVPWFNYTYDNGCLFSPYLSNIHIFNIGASVKPCENTTLALQGYYYMKADHDTFAGSNGNIDVGGLYGWMADGHHTDLGWEVDAILGYDYSKDVRFQLVYGMFIPGVAYTKELPISTVAQVVRAEMNVKF